jgi:heme-degrading monooxygenase HmoA
LNQKETIKSQVTHLYLFSFSHNKFWAFKQMGIGFAALRNIQGLSFFKLLGTGAGQGFSLRPDFSTYALLTVWENQPAADHFYKSNSLINSYRIKASAIRRLSLTNRASHGLWSGQNPFKGNDTDEVKVDKVAIITRATLRFGKLWSFWRAVPKASKAIENAKGVDFYKGIGEWPFIQQATISIWDSMEDVMQFAYRDKAHKEIVKQTKQERWYSEDLFARFNIINDQQLL